MKQLNEKNNCVLSVIIPVYNCEKYLERAVNSVLNQPCGGKLEVIIIDDGSKDNSGLIADKIAEDNKNVRVFHRENAGVSAARNFGINNASGKYIAFLDSDDWWEPSFFDNGIFDEFLESNIDIYGFSYRRVSENMQFCYNVCVTNDTKSFTGNSLNHFENWDVFCSFVYLKELLTDNEILFPNAKVAEDRVFAEKAFFMAKNFKTINKFIFSYWSNAKSCVHKTNPLEKLKQIIYAYIQLDEWLANHEEKYNISTITSIYCYIYLPGCVCYNKLKLVKETMQQEPYNLVYNHKNYDLDDNTHKCLEEWIRSPLWFCIKYRIINNFRYFCSCIIHLFPALDNLAYRAKHFEKYNYPYKF